MKYAAMALGLVLSGSAWAYGVDESKVTTPDEALAALKAGNERFLTGSTLNQDFGKQIGDTAGGQQPYASVLSCLDSRIPPEIIFDQGIGDVFVGRVAGNVEDTAMVGSFEFATEVVGTKVLVIMGHTSCGAVKGACAGVELGNLTGLLDEIEPAIDLAASSFPEAENVCDADHVDHVSEANVRKTIADIRERSDVMRQRELDGKLKIVGAMYDVGTGKVTWMDPEPMASALPATP